MVTTNPSRGRSSMGCQYTSDRPTEPSHSFGKQDRDDYTKSFMSEEHSKRLTTNANPGSKYEMGSSIGKQVLSKKNSSTTVRFGSGPRLEDDPEAKSAAKVPGPGAYRAAESCGKQTYSVRETAPDFVFGSSTRDQSEKVYLTSDHAKVNYGLNSPGPAQYTQSGCIGKQMDSTKESLPVVQFTKDGRFQYDYVKRASALPGAGQYKTSSSCGNQTDSKKSSMPQFGMGTSSRDHRKKVYISADHEKVDYGVHSPGPGTGNQRSAVGKQVLSSKSSRPSWGFGSAKRLNEKKVETPGPGAYDKV